MLRNLSLLFGLCAFILAFWSTSFAEIKNKTEQTEPAQSVSVEKLSKNGKNENLEPLKSMAHNAELDQPTKSTRESQGSISESWIDKLERFAPVISVINTLLWLGAIIAAILVPRGIAKTQVKLMEKQNDIASKQIELTEKQCDISLKQVDITKQQNSIALYDKRLNIFSRLEKLKIFREILNSRGNPFYEGELAKDSGEAIWQLVMGYFVSQDRNMQNIKIDTSNAAFYFTGEIERTTNLLHGIDLIFIIDEDVNANIENLANKYSSLGMQLLIKFSDDYLKSKDAFIDVFDKLKIDDLLKNLRAQIKVDKAQLIL